MPPTKTEARQLVARATLVRTEPHFNHERRIYAPAAGVKALGTGLIGLEVREGRVYDLMLILPGISVEPYLAPFKAAYPSASCGPSSCEQDTSGVGPGELYSARVGRSLFGSGQLELHFNYPFGA